MTSCRRTDIAQIALYTIYYADGEAHPCCFCNEETTDHCCDCGVICHFDCWEYYDDILRDKFGYNHECVGLNVINGTIWELV